MARIASFGAYVPLYRLSRQQIGDAWGVPAAPGERAVANADEDSLTMAVAAGLDCLVGIDPSTIDGLFFATTTAPYNEKQSASVIAAALDMRRDINTADFTGSLRAASTAIRAAADAVDSGSARSILVTAGDCRLGEPESMWEQLLGDGAGAVLVSLEGPIDIKGALSLAGDQVGPWRRSEDRYVRSFEAKVETQYGYAKTAIGAAKTLMEKQGVAATDIAKAVVTANDPRSHAAVGRTLGFQPGQLQDTLFLSVGSPGAALVLMMLAGALEQAKAGDRLLVVNHGDGADAFLLELTADMPPTPDRKGLSGHLLEKRQLPGYTSYAHFRHLLEREEPVADGSPVTYWRDALAELNFHGARCLKCGVVQYPPPRVCGECGTKDDIEDVKLARRGAVYTYTLDHLAGGQYLNVPIPRLVIDLEGGGRVFLEMTDGDPQEVKVGLPVEVLFRRLHEAANFHNYYWKARPLPQASS
ncbi:MAG: OB-fold domain-containing protein [Dehalococcoidia bacterium]